MNKLIVTVFENESNAFEGLTALKSLHTDGTISVYATAVVSKNVEGESEVKENTSEGPLGLSIGLLTGSLFGMLAGPIGMAVGAGVGALGGGAYDLSRADIDVSFVNEVSEALNPGKVAVISEIEETWTTPVDSRMAEFGGLVFRRNKTEVVDDYYTRESEAFKAEMHELNEELKDANDTNKATINAEIAKVKAKSKALNEATQRRLAHKKVETEAKLKTLKEQMVKANDKRKKKLEKRMNEIIVANEKQMSSLGEVSGGLAAYIL